MPMRLICLLFPILFLSQTLFAEVTLDLYGGLSNTKNSNVNITLLDYVPTKTASEPINGNSNIYGMRVVGWLSHDSWIGIGADLYTFQANSATAKITPLAVSATVMFRYPDVTWKPDRGVGLSASACDIVISRESDLGVQISETTQSSFGWDFSTGIAWSIYSHVLLFAEYRYTHIDVDFGDEKFYESNTKIDSTLNSNHYLIGISLPLWLILKR